MTPLIKRACNGNLAAMTALYEANKNRIYSFSRILLDNKQKAAGVAVTVLNEMWDLLAGSKAESEAELTAQLLESAAKRCRTQLLSKWKPVDGRPAAEVPALEQQAYTGPVETGLRKLQLALGKLDAGDRLAYLLVSAGGYDYKEAGRILRQKDPTGRQCYEAAAAALPDLLKKAGDGQLAAEQVLSLLEQAMAEDTAPEAVDSACMEVIRAKAKQQTSRKCKTAVWAGAAVAAVILCVVLLVTFLKPGPTYYADIKIRDYGTITVKLDSKAAPITVDNFVKLAQSGFYDGISFHRIMEGFMMQGGDPDGDGIGGSDQNIVGEFAANGYPNPISHTRGTISMARTGNDYNSASSQFFIMHQDYTGLDGQYAAFGKVVSGMEIVDAICEASEPLDNNGKIAVEARPIMETITIRQE